MKELFGRLDELTETIAAQGLCLEQFLPLLEAEEICITGFDLAALERTVVAKNTLVQRMVKRDEKRQQIVRRVCFLVGYDARGEVPSLKEFLSVLKHYQAQVGHLLPEEDRERLALTMDQFEKKSFELKGKMEVYNSRIKQNKIILSKLQKNLSQSLQLLSEISHNAAQYSARGKTSPHEWDKASSIRVRV